MALLYVSLPLAALLAVGHAHSLNISAPVPWTKCEHDRSRVMPIIGPYVPQCDANGNFLPQQCWGSTGYCWCVNVLTGEEIPGTRTPPGTLPVDCYGGSPESNMHGDYCPDGWMRHGMRCMIFINTSKTWIEAEFYCMFEGATLVSIHSREENRFVQELTRGDGHTFPPTWIGAHDSIQVGIWLWADGSSFDFFLRIDIHANSSCLGMNSGVQMVWKPYPCEKQLPFVCAKNI